MQYQFESSEKTISYQNEVLNIKESKFSPKSKGHKQIGVNRFLALGAFSNNQNGNLRWFSPWREGGLEFHIPILKNDFFENHLESFPDCENVFCT